MPAKLKYFRNDPDNVGRGSGLYYKRYGKGERVTKCQRHNGKFIHFNRIRTIRYVAYSQNISTERKYLMPMHTVGIPQRM